MPYSNPEQQKDYKRDWARMRRAGESGTPSGTMIPAPFRLQTAMDVVALIESQVNAVLDEAEAGTLEKARVVGYLATVALRAVEVGDLSVRIEAMEAALNGRGKQ